MSLQIKNLTKRFGRNVILGDFSYDFKEKGVYLIKGDSGVGKTTLLRIIAGLDKDFDGEITGGGLGKVSMAFQEYRLFPTLNALDNVLKVAFNEPSADDVKRTEDLLSYLSYSSEDMKKYPDELSGGMKQRVSLARAFLAEGEILLLDEPTKELDSELASKVNELILREGKRRLVIVVSHRLQDEQSLDATVITITDKK